MGWAAVIETLGKIFLVLFGAWQRSEPKREKQEVEDRVQIARRAIRQGDVDTINGLLNSVSSDPVPAKEHSSRSTAELISDCTGARILSGRGDDGDHA